MATGVDALSDEWKGGVVPVGWQMRFSHEAKCLDLWQSSPALE